MYLFCVYLFSEQYGGVAVLLAGLRAQSDEPEQEQRQTGAPDYQLPVIVTLQKRFMDVKQLKKQRYVYYLANKGTSNVLSINIGRINHIFHDDFMINLNHFQPNF